MADVGKSTTAHATERNPMARVAKERLINWGRWQRSLPHDAPRQFPDQPMFREMVQQYRETHAPAPFDAEQAEYTEEMLNRILPMRDVWVCRLRFIVELPSRRAAGVLSRMRFRCSHVTYLAWVEVVIDRVAAEIQRRIAHEDLYGNPQSREAVKEGKKYRAGA